MGVYSGRANEKTEVCRVWKAEVIHELNWPLKEENNLIEQREQLHL